MDLRPGATIDDRLRLVRPLGKGGMGHVWVAHQTALDTEVAVKFVSSELSTDAEMIERFRREARLAAQIKSPHVVQIFDHGVTPDGTAYIVMELLEGESLAAKIRREECLPIDEVGAIIEDVARALAAAHELDIVHRDIKPENVFLVQTRGGRERESFAKVLDFGIARRTESETAALTRTGAVIGTPGYMSPEQLDDTSRVGPSTDLWAMGVMVYQALTGKMPFKGTTVVSLWRAIQAGEAEPPSRARAGLPIEIDAWFERAFALDPERRFETARSMSDTFQALVRGPRSDAEVIPDAATILANPPVKRVASEATKGAMTLPTSAIDREGARSMRLLLLAVAVVMAAGVVLIAYMTLKLKPAELPPTHPVGAARDAAP